MKRHNRLIIIFILVLLLIFQNIFINAENGEDLLAISLIIDTSGSMKETDPQRLREKAANVFIDLLAQDDFLGIITFDNYVNLVIPMEQLKDNSVRQSFKERLAPHLEAGGDTNYTAAFIKANEELSKLEAPSSRKVIVLLTDGKPTINNSESMWKVVTDLSLNDYPVYSIGFSDDVDVDILNRIAEETKGNVRIFKDDIDLDKNLIQLLKSREIIAEQLLTPKEDLLSNMLSLSTDFWMKREGYRNGEEAIVSATLNLGTNRLQRGIDLKIDKFNLNIYYDDGTDLIIPLLDDGEVSHGDIMVDDGIWSNKIVFDKNGKGKASIIVSGIYKNEPFMITKSIGEYVVAKPGNVFITSYEKNLLARKGKTLSIPLSFNNVSPFKEVVFIDIDEKIGSSSIKQIGLEPNSKVDLDLLIDLNSNLDNGNYDLTIGFKPLNEFTTIGYTKLNYKIEVISYFENLSRNIKTRYEPVIAFAGIVIGILLFIYIIGILLYILIVRPQVNIKGVLTYWDGNNFEDCKSIDLTNKKKKEIIITFNPEKDGDFYIPGSKFNYDIVITKEFIEKRRNFILGWKTLFTRNADIIQILICTKPGIIIYESDIYTSITLNHDKEFSSGGFDFHFTKYQPKWIKEAVEGRNILEDRHDTI